MGHFQIPENVLPLFEHKFGLTRATAFSNWWNSKWHLSISLSSLGCLTGCILSEISPEWVFRPCLGGAFRDWLFFFFMSYDNVIYVVALLSLGGKAGLMFQLPHITGLCQRVSIVTMFLAHTWDIVLGPINEENGFQNRCNCEAVNVKYILGVRS